MYESSQETLTSGDQIEELFNLYREYGNSDYIGEPVSQLQHALQAADEAETGGYGDEVILASFFHDIGHLVGARNECSKMETGGIQLGMQNHAELGEKYLEASGIKGDISKLVGMHVQAKRYLVAANKDYYNKLSDASKMTLEHQGGPMSAEELKNFERNELKETTLKMRNWDERAKIPDRYNDEKDAYKRLKNMEQRLREYLNRQH